MNKRINTLWIYQSVAAGQMSAEEGAKIIANLEIVKERTRMIVLLVIETLICAAVVVSSLLSR